MEAVLLIGIPASGKSTFYHQHFANTHVRLNLDMLKTRARERILLEACLRARQSFVVDNTNILAAERAVYIAPALEAGFQVTGYFFETTLSEALQRNRQRPGKAAIPERGLLARWRRLQPPSFEEGFHRLFSVSIAEGGGFTVRAWGQEGGES